MIDYDAWKLEAPKVEYWKSFEEFKESLTDKQVKALEDEYESQFNNAEGDCQDIDKFWQWVREEKYL